MGRFIPVAEFVLEVLEGFWSDDPDDRGGATQYGVSLKLLRRLPDADGDGVADGDLNRDGVVDERDVRLVTHDEALRVYRVEFWDPCRCDRMPAGVDAALLGAAINHGPGTATHLLQDALGVKSDGVIGPVTIAAAHASDREALLADYLSRRAQLYHDIVTADSSQARWLRGWMRRLFLMHAFALGAT